ncbi:protein-disulfide reductase DsbD [Massilia glaciei]|uniref:Thiol:disulfide interchange protein DsbD n=1 Tax=Massilia glaciei TaxID=1524097 RepID=A0A2U2I5F3_9BURK|nr:protein-disulfide reductase DsbD [Massilia glaciei]PWF54855.1 protein-disulfide reductase DsbD [Massilia glaciei]
MSISQPQAGARASIPARWLGLALALLAALVCLFASAPALAEEEFLDPADAFKFSARMRDAQTVEVNYEIADGYYMYRERFKFTAAGATLGEPVMPKGEIKFDETFNKDVEMYRGRLTIAVPVAVAPKDGRFTLTASSQGCADKGLCYSPQDASASLDTGAAGAAQTGAAQTGAAPAGAAPTSELGVIAGVLGGGKLLVIIPAFILLGLGLAFTPCVLPMLPILSSIIVGEGARATRRRALALSASYSAGMILVYTVLGVAAGLAGEGLGATLQDPWVLRGVALLIAALSLSMFGLYELQLPSALQTLLVRASGRHSSGKLIGVFAMGAISALIVGPCVAAPLAAALVYIGQSRDVVVGASALFALAVGMSIPLMLLGFSAGLLPKNGAWMVEVKRFFGVVMLGLALWLAVSAIPPALYMFGWMALLLGYGAYLLRMRPRKWQPLALGAVFSTLGALQLVGLASGSRDVLAPLSRMGAPAPAHGIDFARVKTEADLDAALAAAKGKTVMLDFYADWCVSCKEMEKFTFVVPAVKARLAGTVLLQVDVTANDAADKAMLKRFGLFGPPAIILFDGAGSEIADSRVVGYQDGAKFLVSLEKLK